MDEKTRIFIVEDEKRIARFSGKRSETASPSMSGFSNG